MEVVRRWFKELKVSGFLVLCTDCKNYPVSKAVSSMFIAYLESKT